MYKYVSQLAEQLPHEHGGDLLSPRLAGRNLAEAYLNLERKKYPESTKKQLRHLLNLIKKHAPQSMGRVHGHRAYGGFRVEFGTQVGFSQVIMMSVDALFSKQQKMQGIYVRELCSSCVMHELGHVDQFRLAQKLLRKSIPRRLVTELRKRKLYRPLKMATSMIGTDRPHSQRRLRAEMDATRKAYVDLAKKFNNSLLVHTAGYLDAAYNKDAENVFAKAARKLYPEEFKHMDKLAKDLKRYMKALKKAPIRVRIPLAKVYNERLNRFIKAYNDLTNPVLRPLETALTPAEQKIFKSVMSKIHETLNEHIFADVDVKAEEALTTLIKAVRENPNALADSKKSMLERFSKKPA